MGEPQRLALDRRRLGLRERLGAHRAAEVRADGRDGVEGLALAEDEEPLVGQELEPVGEVAGAPELDRGRRVVGDVGDQRAQRGDGLGGERRRRPRRCRAFMRNSRRSRSSVMRSSSVARRGEALGDREPLHGHGVGGAADGAQPAADAAVVVLDHGGQRQPVRVGALAPAPRARPRGGPAPRRARGPGSTRGRRPRSGCRARTSRGRRSSARGRRGSARPGAGPPLVVAGLDLRDAGAPAEVEGGRRLAVEDLEAGDHAVARGRDLLDLEQVRRSPRRSRDRYSWIERAARLPLATASIRLRGPKATSPPAKTPGAEVARVSRVHADRAAGRQLDAVSGLQEGEVRLLADGQDAGVGVEVAITSVVVAGREAAVLVEDRDARRAARRARAGRPEEALRTAAR